MIIFQLMFGLFKNKSFEQLRTFNIAMGFFHLFQAVLMYLVSNDFKLPVTTSYLQSTGEGFPTPVLETWFNVPVGTLVASFLLLSALAHFFVACPWFYNWYVENLKKEINYARWYEYALSSSIMIVLIAMLSGIYDFSLLVVLFAINACMNLFGLIMEKHNQITDRVDWTSFIFGSFAGLVPWLIIAVSFINAVSDASGNVPTFVYFILGSLFLTFNIFPINMILQYKRTGKWNDYLYGEKVYIVLSLVAKSLLAWQVWAGTLRPQ